MSEQLTLEGVALDKKDKSELQSIVQALGGKPSARARKSDLIEQILELSGVTTAGGAEVGAGPEPEQPTQAGDPASEAPEPTPRSAGDERAEQASVGRDRGDDQPSGGDVQDRGGDNGGRGSRSDEGRGGSRGGSAAGRPQRDEADRSRGDQGGRRGDQGSEQVTFEAEGRGGRSARDGGDRNGSRQAGPGGERGDDRNQRRDRDRDDDGGRGRSRGEQREAGDRGDQGSRRGGDEQSEREGEAQDNDRDAGRDDAEGGRRRRRRGRDRDRDRDREESQAEPVPVEGHLDLRDEGYGFLRVQGYLPSRDDVYVSVKHVRQHGLRRGDFVTGLSRPAARNEKNPALHQVDTVNGRAADELPGRPRFEDLTPLFPDQRLRLEIRGEPQNMTARIIDLIAPIGKGQRGLIVSPPKAGKTTIMKQIARAIEMNNPEVELIVLLVDERPEEVTDMKRWLQRGSVVASTFDRPSEEHCAVAELTIERAKRMVEEGKDVCIILDGITRLARAYNLAAPGTGRIMSGGVDSGALYPPKKFFGAARNLEEGGSLTILATALVDTGSKMDEVIFEEFKGTGNMELRLDRRMAERRIFPAVDVAASSTRHEELLFERRQVNLIYKLRKVLSGVAGGEDASPAAATELLIDRLSTFRTNDEFLAEIAKSPV